MRFLLIAISAIASVAVDEGGLHLTTSAIASVAIDEGEIVTHQEARPDGSTPDWKPVEFSEESVLVLSAANFTMARGHFPVMLVQFYAPWCSHSRALAPEFAAAADELQARGLEVRLAKVDAVAEEALADLFHVAGYPTLLWFTSLADEHPREYLTHGNHKAGEIVEWVVRRLGPPVVEVSDAAAARTWVTGQLRDPMMGIVLQLPASSASALRPALDRAAAPYVDRARVAYTTDAQAFAAAVEVANKHGAASTTGASGNAMKLDKNYLQQIMRAAMSGKDAPVEQVAALVLKPHDERVVRASLANSEGAHEGASTEGFEDGLKTLVVTHALPQIVPFTEAYEAALVAGPAHVQLLAFGTPAQLAAEELPLRALSRRHVGKCLVVFVDVHEDASDGLLELFRVDEAQVAAADGLTFFGIDLGHDFEAEVRYAPPEGRPPPTPGTPGAALEKYLDGFVNAMLEGKAAPVRQSEPLPEVNDGPVALVVGDTFDTLVNVSGLDVLLQIFAPWCGHCKKLEPEYLQLGVRFAEIKSVVIAKMDGTKNEVPGLEYDGFPTLYLFTASNRQIPVGIDVELSVEGLTEFLQAHAEVKIDAGRLRGKDEL
jgi:protein disulfide-isomerase A1